MSSALNFGPAFMRGNSADGSSSSSSNLHVSGATGANRHIGGAPARPLAALHPLDPASRPHLRQELGSVNSPWASHERATIPSGASSWTTPATKSNAQLDQAHSLEQRAGSVKVPPFIMSRDYMLSLWSPSATTTTELPIQVDKDHVILAQQANTPLAFIPMSDTERTAFQGSLNSRHTSAKLTAQSGPSNGVLPPGSRQTREHGQAIDSANARSRETSAETKPEPAVGIWRRSADRAALAAQEPQTRPAQPGEYTHHTLTRMERNASSMLDSLALDEDAHPRNDMRETRAASPSAHANGLTQSSGPPPGLSQPDPPELIQWQYRDPSGQVQGPFSGSQMQEWYRQQFFNADLLVKPVSVPTFEPLGALLLRVGDRFAPFLNAASSQRPPELFAHSLPSQSPSYSPSLPSQSQYRPQLPPQSSCIHQTVPQRPLTTISYLAGPTYNELHSQPYDAPTPVPPQPQRQRQHSAWSLDPPGGEPKPLEPSPLPQPAPSPLADYVRSLANPEQPPEPTAPIQPAQDEPGPMKIEPEPESDPEPEPVIKPTVQQQLPEPVKETVLATPVVEEAKPEPAPVKASPWNSVPNGTASASSAKRPATLRDIQAKEAEETKSRRQLIREAKAAKLAADAEARAAREAAEERSNLPSTTSWAQTTDSPPATTPSAWQKSQEQTKKMTLQEIQQQEEAARKQAKANAAAKQRTATRGYAGVAAPGPAASTGEPWSTVGASGKTPAVVKPVAPVRSTSASAPALKAEPARSAATSKPSTRPAVSSKAPPALPPAAEAPPAPSPAFMQWCTKALKGLTVPAEGFIQVLLSFPIQPDPTVLEIISDSVYANSRLLDGRRFANEFVTRRQADYKAQKAGTVANMETSKPKAPAKPASMADALKTKPMASPAGPDFRIIPARKKNSAGRS
ncbi:uncharacterized protein L969DRAFT_89711 [Mixia osmundae IAM 14324]|uniref:GYF domain-containing protein n=1 Tax=Mixia osmundae (strain CBS 9802 / IAM 14324 / JCM 22182 / KY 12970) TaxID=764103 RepID=G7E4W8_MIXOS|nr:uncharacterized protein L969DRAFT_89711 [Mixia osmundae IAM 14324]KEI37740.1 hypothetical protein L969DRAFT_89711 [Mixia osmundae IAM 14324]GAA97878.1 hypothetical protein E5Q_04558 [Mixia osmundae IAM 14324]